MQEIKSFRSIYNNIFGTDKKIYRKYGIMTAYLTDPMSLIINKILDLGENKPNAVGFYYEDLGLDKCYINLFNIYDNYPVPWMKLGSSMDSLLLSPFVTNVVYYPLIKEDKDEIFRATMIDVINENSKLLSEKTESFYNILISTISGPISSNQITGYNLVNNVLLKLIGNDTTIQTSDLSSSILNCPIIGNISTINAPQVDISNNEIYYITEELRKDLTDFIAVFIELFTTNEDFRKKILNKSLYNNDLENLLFVEQELINNLVGSMKNGLISNKTLNDFIEQMNTHRKKLTNLPLLPLSHLPERVIRVIDQDITCTFQESTQILPKNNSLIDLGLLLQNIVNDINTNKPLILNLSPLISYYNDIIKNSGLDNDDTEDLIITPPLKNGSQSATVIFSPDINVKIPIPTITNKPVTIEIPIFNANLSILSQSQLLDILIYLDSLKSYDGPFDNRFISLQNQITHELALRSHSKV